MRVRFLWIGVLVALLVPAVSAPAANQTVTATSSNTFSPRTVVVNTGDMVTWNNGGGFHNVHFADNSFVQPPSPSSSAWSVSRTFTTPGTFRYFCDAHAPTMSGTVWVNGPGYARPTAASPLRASLTPAYKPCPSASANRTHGPSLEHPSCNPPVQESNWLTVGTVDANGAAPNSVGSVRFRAIPGIPSTPAVDEADFEIAFSMTDIRNKSGLTDYAGEIQVRSAVRLTSRNNSTGGPPFEDPATGDHTFLMTVPCTGNGNAGVGSTCSLTTTMDALMPGAVPEGKRSIWELGKVEVRDGGSDGDVDTPTGNTLFATQGFFIP